MALPAGFDQCLELLRKGRSDNELFAGLLLVTRLVQANQIDGETRRRIFDAVGFDFLNRLIATSVVPEGCSEHVYSSLALTVLACFAMDEGLASDPQMLTKIPFFCSVASSSIRSENDEVLAMADDALHCLTAISLIPEVRQHLITRSTVAVLVQRGIEGCGTSMDIVLRLACSERKMLYSTCSDEMAQLIQQLSQIFKVDQDMKKFEACKQLAILIGSEIQSTLKGLEEWQADIQLGLSDILHSRVAPQYCQDALALARSVIESVGIKWAFTGAQDRASVKDDFASVLLQQTVVETKLCLERETVEEVLENKSLLSSCYCILEQYIHFVVTEGEGSLLSAQSVSQIHNAVEDAIRTVITFLLSVAMSEEADKAVLMKQSIVHASVRVLAAWMAEETASLQSESAKLMPFLIALGRQSLMEIQQSSWMSSDSGCVGDDIIRFLLPAVCHLSADNTTRLALIRCKCHSLLVDYFTWKMGSFKSQLSPEADPLDRQDTEAAVLTCCSALLNFCVLEPRLVTSSDDFQRLAKFVSMFFHTTEMDHHVVLSFNCITLAVMLLQSVDDTSITYSDLRGFWEKVTHHLGKPFRFSEDCSDCHLSEPYKEYWADIKDLWSLSMQGLSACVDRHPVAQQVLLDMEWCSCAARWIRTLSQRQERSSVLACESNNGGEEAEVSFRHLVDVLSTHNPRLLKEL